MTYQIKHAIAKLLNRGADDAQYAYYIRTKADIADQALALKELPIETPRISNLLTGICFAKNWVDVWNLKSLPKIANSQKAINWLTVLLNQYAEQISNHALLRNELVHAMMHGHWETASKVLHAHFDTFGPTIWYMNWSLLLAEERSGAQARLATVAGFDNPSYGKSIPTFARIFSLSCDKSLPEEHFRSTIKENIPAGNRVWSQFLELILMEDYSRPWKTWEILECAESLPLIDRYELFIRLAAIAYASDHEDAAKLIRSLVRLRGRCKDHCLEYLVESADNDVLPTSCGATSSLLKAWDAYMVSNYNECFTLALNMARVYPDSLAAHEILVKSSIYLKDIEHSTGTNPLELLWYHLRNIFSKNEQSEDSLSFLQRFATRFRILTMTAPLRALHAQHSTPFPDIKWQKRASYVIGAHGPRNFEYAHSSAINKAYLGKLSKVFSDSQTIAFFQSVSNNSSNLQGLESSTIPIIRWRFYSGLAAARDGRFGEALRHLHEFLKMQETDTADIVSPFGLEEARRLLIDIYLKTGALVEMQDVVIQAYLDKPQAIRRLPIKDIFNICLRNSESVSNRIEYPILAYLANSEPHDVCIELKRCLSTFRVSTPIELVKLGLFKPNVLATLFVRVCTIEVLDSMEALNSLDKVEAERIAILNWVVINAPQFSRVSENEVLRITQHAQLREALSKIEETRIVVNVAALRESEQERFSDAYFRFSAQRELATNQTKDEIISALNIIQVTGSKVVVIPADILRDKRKSTSIAFIQAFREIRDAFVYSPHFGIESCLSGRIRHGIVVQHIRKPFAEGRLLITKGDSDFNEASEISLYWGGRLQLQDKREKLDAIIGILVELTTRINAIAEDVRNIWLQSRTEARNPSALFDFSFSDDQLEGLLKTKFFEISSVEAFVDHSISILLDRTRMSLQNVTLQINTKLKLRLRQEIDSAISALNELSEEGGYLALRNDLVACRHASELTCDQMEKWFHNTDATLMGDASFELVAGTAVGMVEQLNPQFRGKHEISVSSGYRVRGGYFTALVHILFFLLENAIRHTNLSKDSFVSFVSIKTSAHELAISVSHSMVTKLDAEAAAERILNKVAELQAALDPDKVIKEGGSGFAKIIAAARYEFKQKNPAILAETNQEHLKTSVVLELSKVAYECVNNR